MPNPPSERPPRPPAILIVDDDPEMAALLRDALERERFRAVAETRGRDALAAAEREVFDLVIVDKEIPDINGLDLISELRGRLPELRAILLTAFGGALCITGSPSSRSGCRACASGLTT